MPERIYRPVWILLLCVVVIPWNVQAQIFKIPHPDTTAGNGFGGSLDIEGNRALVGASAENVCGFNSGAAYIYERTSESEKWQLVARITPGTCVEGDFFGRSVSLSGDRAVIAASGNFTTRASSNTAYIFERDPETGAWYEARKIAEGPDGGETGSFASSVSLDGDRLLITAAGDPIQQNFHGAAYLYEWNEAAGQWQRSATLKSQSSLTTGIFGGYGVLDGNHAVITASTYYEEKPGSIYIFERDSTTGVWDGGQRIGGIDDLFITVDMSGDHILVGESRAGRRKSGEAILLEKMPDGKWEKAHVLKPNAPYELGAFGSAVSFNGKQALVAGYDEQLGKNFNIDRVVYEFKFHEATGTWRQGRIFDVGEVAFGYAIAMGDMFGIIGQVSDQEPGAVYVVQVAY